MPSYLARLFGVSFQTERLIMNIIGLVNSTLDWSPLKWTDKLEQIWSLSLSQRTLILDTIGEERIKAVLSYIVIARILIAHVFTFSYMTNFYPIITWSRPNLLLPWLLISFFKNVVLEVIVIAVGLLLWYDRRFSLPIFLEFVVLKVVPLIFAVYNWYSNSCLYFELRRVERLRKLRRTMRSDSNIIVSRLYLKMAESKYRTRSVTTLISWQSYETNETSDTISRILEDPNLTPAQKAMKLLGLTDQEIEDARGRVKEREMRRRLTEMEDEEFERKPRDSSKYFSIVNRYAYDMRTLLAPRGVDLVQSDAEKEEENGDSNAERKDSEKKEDRNNPDSNGSSASPTMNSSAENNATQKNPNSSKDSGNSKESGNSGNPENTGTTKSHNPRSRKEATLQKISEISEKNKRISLRNRSPDKAFGNPMDDLETDLDWSSDVLSLPRRRGDVDNLHIVQAKTNPKRNCKKRDGMKSNCERNGKLNDFDDNCNPLKTMSPFNCHCESQDCSFNEKLEEYDLPRTDTIKTSTPNSYRNERDFYEKTVAMDGGLIVEDRSLNVEFDTMMVDKVEDDLFDDVPIVKNRSVQEDIMIVSDKRNVISRQHAVAVSAQNVSQFLRNSEDSEDTETVKMVKVEESVKKMKKESETTKDVKCENINDAKTVHKGTLSPYKDIDKNLLDISLTEHSFGDTNIHRFYKDSMKVFDGCYEKDFPNNSEIQCLLKQLEKKKWSLFPGQANHEILMSSFLMQNDQFMKHDFGAVYHATNEYDSLDRYDVSSGSRTNFDRAITEIVKANEEYAEIARTRHRNRPSKFAKVMKNAYTQTGEENLSKCANGSTSDSRKRRKFYPKRKQSKEEGKTVSPVNSLENRRTESRNSCSKNNSRVSLRQRVSKTTNDSKKPPRACKSMSDKSVCECKMSFIDGKRSNSTVWRWTGKDERKGCGTKCKIENLGTVPLPRVARPSMFDTVVFRRKPPVYPKKLKNEALTQTVPSVASSKKMSALKKLLEATKKPCEKQSAQCGSKKVKLKGRLETMEEQEAREMRALKAYNEVTLLKDKKELEARKRNPSSDVGSDTSRSRLPIKKGNLEVTGRNVSKVMEELGDPCLDKENLFVDATTETEPSSNELSRDIKIFIANDKLANVSNDKFPCEKLSKIGKVTDKLLDNFDRLHGGQLKRDSRRSKQNAETETGKLYTKCNKPLKMADEENVSIRSAKKVEGIQKGRELDRTQAKEDVTGRSRALSEISTQNVMSGEFLLTNKDLRSNDRNYYNVVASTSTDITNRLRSTNEDLLRTIKPSTVHGIISSWSTSTLDENDDLQYLENGNAFKTTPEETQFQSIPYANENHQTSPEDLDVFEPSTSTSTKTIMSRKQVDHRFPKKDREEERNLSSMESNGDPISDGGALNFHADFSRNFEVTCTRNHVILSNPSAPLGEKPQPRNIVDDDTRRMLHHAFSDRSICVLSDLSAGVLTLNVMLNSGQTRPDDDDFGGFHPNRETMGTVMEDLPPLSGEETDSLEQTILATIRRFQNLEEEDYQEEGSLDLLITIIDHEGVIDLNNLVLEDIPATVIRSPRYLNVPGLGLHDFHGIRYQILSAVLTDEEYEHEEEEIEKEEDEEDSEMRFLMEARTLRFLEEDIFTDIRFPIEVRLSDVVEDVPEEANPTDVRSSKINFFSPNDKEENFEEEAEESLEEIRMDPRRTFFKVTFPTCQFTDANVLVLDENSLSARRFENVRNECAERKSFMEFLTCLKKCTVASPTIDSPRRGNLSREVLSRTFESLKEIDEEEDCYAEESVRSDDLETNGDVDGFKEDDVKKQRTKNGKKTKKTLISKGKLAALEEKLKNEDSDEILDSESETKRLELNDEMTFKVILTFWLLVLYFYVRHFYNKVFALKRVSESTSTLKPFEIHTVPTSTTTLFENAELVKRLAEEETRKTTRNGMDEEDEEEERSTFLDGIVDLREEDENASQSEEYQSLLNLNSTAFTVASDNFDQESSSRSEKEIERTTLYLMKRVTENVKILPFFRSEESIFQKANKDRRQSNSISSNLIAETGLENGEPISDRSSIFFDSKNGDVEVKSFDGFTDSPRKLELILAEGEIDALRYRVDDDSISSRSLNRNEEDLDTTSEDPGFSFVRAEVRMEEVEETSIGNKMGNDKERNSFAEMRNSELRIHTFDEKKNSVGEKRNSELRIHTFDEKRNSKLRIHTSDEKRNSEPRIQIFDEKRNSDFRIQSFAEKRNSELRIQTSDEKRNSELRIQTSDEKRNSEPRIQIFDEKRNSDFRIQNFAEKRNSELRIQTSDEKRNSELRIQTSDEKRNSKLRIQTSDEKRNSEPRIQIFDEKRNSEPRIHTFAEKRNSESSEKSFHVSSFEERLSEDNGRENLEGTREFSRKIVEENGEMMEERKSECSAKVFHMNLETNDSFDSTYTRASETSRNTGSLVDLNDSSMEEFTIGSNASDDID